MITGQRKKMPSSGNFRMLGVREAVILRTSRNECAKNPIAVVTDMCAREKTSNSDKDSYI